MDISVREIREKLTPLLCSLRIGSRKCKNPRCAKAINDIQEWIDNIYIVDQKENPHCIGEHKDWTR
ncbi:MAG TPA: hypothetical protein DCR68_02300 [Coprothermobacter sp.]|nr:hypothetical protein [Coprothermobacter sp.]